MSGFTKLFNSILHSTIWSEPNETRILWITMLAMSDKSGCVNASVPGLARMAGITVEETQQGIEKFLSPDPFSRTPDHEGRRVEVIDGGWHLLNHGKYRALLSAEERREYNRRKQQERRQKMSNSGADMSMTVNDNQQCQHIAEAEAEAEKERGSAGAKFEADKKSAMSSASNAGVPPDFAAYVFGDWHSRDGRDGGNVQVKWAGYVKKRWDREQGEWNAKTHKGNKGNGAAPHQTRKLRSSSEAYGE